MRIFPHNLYKPAFRFTADREEKELNDLVSFDAPIKYYQTNKGIVARCMVQPKQVMQEVKIRSKSQSHLRKPRPISLMQLPLPKLSVHTTINKENHERGLNQSEIIYDIIKTRIANKLNKVRDIRMQIEDQVHNLNQQREVPCKGGRMHSKSLHVKKATFLPPLLP
jgi:hypothetical protein